jgi:signal transduction histidine kinase
VMAGLAVLFALTTAPLVNLLREQLDSWFKGTRGAQRALLYQFTSRVGDEISLDQVARAFSAALEQGVQPEFATLWLWDNETRALYPVLSTGTLPGGPATVTLNESAQHRLAMQSTFVVTDERMNWLSPFEGYLSLVWSGALVGVCAIGPRIDGGQHSADASRFLETLARSATLAFRNAQLVSQLEDKVSALRRAYQQLISAQENERRNLAAELHDETLQQLAHINLLAGTMQRSTAESSSQNIQQLQQTIVVAEKRLREILRGIHPAVLTNLGLIPALESWLPRSNDVTLTLSTVGFDNRRLPDPDLEMALYRLVQESVNNALDHARADRIDIKLCWLKAEVTLEVADDGGGFEPATYVASMRHADGSTHFGLLNLRERVIALSGNLTIDSQPGRGTTIRAQLPVKAENP